MHLQYILSCSSPSITQLSRPMESKIDPDQWETVPTLFTDDSDVDSFIVHRRRSVPQC